MRYAYCRGELPQPGKLITSNPSSIGDTICETDCGNCIDWLVSDGGFDTSNQIRSLAINYLLTDKRSSEGDPCSAIDERGWWASNCRPDGFELGSKLWLLEAAKMTTENTLKAKEYAEEALSPLVENGIIERLTVDTEICCNELKIIINLYVNGGPIDASIVGELQPGYGYLWSELSVQ